MIFKTKKENESLRKEINLLEDKVSNLNKACISEISRRKTAEERYSEICKKNKELKGVIRDQTDADLLINALKSIGIIKEEKKTDHYAEEQRLMALRQMAGLQGQSLWDPRRATSQGLSSLWGGVI